ncbi:conserved hypothetical protein [Carnobacterium maltaromaticum]|nr:conserved hypothetical protein [Carnobacterium maltaromaticum]
MLDKLSIFEGMNYMDSNINKLLEDNFIENPKKTALIFEDEKYSYEDILIKRKDLEQLIINLNCSETDRVLIISENTSELVPLIFSLAHLNICFSIISKNIEPSQIIDNFNPKLIFVIDEDYNYQFSMHKKLEITIGNIQLFHSTRIEKKKEYFSLKCLCVIYTSGSTGTPKGVGISNENVMFTTKRINEYIQNNKEDVILSYLPITFDYGMYQIFLSFYAHATLVLGRYPLFPGEIFNDIRKYNVTGFPGIRGILDVFRLHVNYEDVKSLRYITNTGDYFNMTIIDKLKKVNSNLNFFLMYGLTECKRVSILDFNRYPDKRESVGFPLRDVEAKILSGNYECAPYEIGTLYVKGRNVCLGYFNNLNETTKYFSGNSFKTKDLFYKDKDGFLYFVGRKDSNFKNKGHIISKEYLELKIKKMLEFCDSFVVYLLDKKEFYVVSYITEFNSNAEDVNFFKKKFIKKYLQLFYDWEIPKEFVFFYGHHPINQNGKVDRKSIEKELNVREKI